MNIEEMNLTQVEERMSSLSSELDNENVSETRITEIEGEISELRKRKEKLNNVEKRKKEMRDIINGGNTVKKFEEEKRDASDFGIGSAEYRAAYLKKIRGLDLSEIEQRTLTTAASSVGDAVPTTTSNKIIEKVHQYAPLLDKIDLLRIAGNVKIPVEGTSTEAAKHGEGTKITGDSETLSSISLSAYEITKLVTISKSVETMSIDAFEKWLVDKIGRSIANKINKLIYDGTGSGEAEGINAITWNDKNSVKVGASASLTEADILKVMSMINGGYLANSEWLMSNSTFWNDFYPLMNKSKNITIACENKKWYVAGYPVTFDERIADDEAIFGDLYMGYVGNLPEDVSVTSQFVARENSFDFLGSCMFDGKVKAIEAFVKIAKEAQS